MPVLFGGTAADTSVSLPGGSRASRLWCGGCCPCVPFQAPHFNNITDSQCVPVMLLGGL